MVVDEKNGKLDLGRGDDEQKKYIIKVKLLLMIGTDVHCFTGARHIGDEDGMELVEAVNRRTSGRNIVTVPRQSRSRAAVGEGSSQSLVTSLLCRSS